ncbi:MAG: LysR family transcriptional regulator [Pseudomonadota bacterium]
MDIKRLQHIVALADEGSFIRAAERVHLSQPAFSRSIQAAEAELEMKLFGRGGGTEVKCTPSGAFVVERARRILHESRSLERDVQLFRSGLIGKVCIGAGPFVAASLLPGMLTAIRLRYPEAEVQVQVNNPPVLIDCVRREELDFFVGETRDVPRDGSFDITTLGGQRAGFYVRASHPLLAKPRLKMRDILPFGLATGRLPRQVRTALQKAMGVPADGSLPVALECDDTHLVRRVVRSTDTVMVASNDILVDELASGVMRRLTIADFPPAYTDLGVVALNGRSHSPLALHAIKQLAALVKDAQA